MNKELIDELRMYADDTFSAVGHCGIATALSQAADAIERLEIELTAATLRIENDTKIITSLRALLMDALQSIGEYQQAGAVQKGMALDAARYQYVKNKQWLVDAAVDAAMLEAAKETK